MRAGAAEISRSNIGSNVEVAMPQKFNRELEKVLEFAMHANYL